mmetsp:Transcript_2691/g.2759  ORF Transcript_2691/g.2759 Transcript_2691/m.2759 type:complete len:240 (+) Transcript_2691:1-720(+)
MKQTKSNLKLNLLTSFILIIVYSILIGNSLQEEESSQVKDNTTSTINVTVNNATNSTDTANSTNETSSLPHAEVILNITSKHKCFDTEDCSSNGLCDLVNNTCECFEEFSTYISEYESIVNDTQIQALKLCNYTKKKQLTALMLSLFVGFGSEHFYLEKIDVGIAKLVFYCVCCAGNIILFAIYMWFPDKQYLIDFLGQYEAIYMACGFVCALLWVIYDLVKIGNMEYLDGNDIPMLSW